MRVLIVGLAVIAFAGPVAAADLPAALQSRLDEFTADCKGFENGTLEIGADAIRQVDVTGDREADWILDSGKLACSTAASLFCGTGGCAVTFLSGDHVLETIAKGWRVASFPPLTVLLLQVHGSECGGTNLRPCVRAVTFDAEGFHALEQ